jgi:hypothetical protein
MLAPCQAWALTAPPDDQAVIGGTTAGDRARIRRARQAAFDQAVSPAPAA